MKTRVHNPILRRSLPGAALATALTALGIAAAGAADATAGASGPAVEQRVRDELRVVMAELVESGAFGDQAPQQLALTVDTPAQRVSDLGLLVDSAHGDRDGVRVLAVTPGGAGERMGLRAGDLLLALNGVSLGDGGGGAATLRQTVDALANGSALAFQVRRDGQTRLVSGALSSVYVPAMRLIVGDAPQLAAAGAASAAAASPAPAAAAVDAPPRGCGRISDFDVAPRQQNLHGAIIISIDGSLPGPRGTPSYRVAAGSHVLQVAERIENRYLTFNDRLRNSSLDRYKTLQVDVQADTTTLIAARLNPDKSNVWQNGAYWDPVAWKQVAEACH